MKTAGPMDEDGSRRAYWSRQMEEAHAFMMGVRQTPVTDCGEPLAPLRDAAADAGVEVVFSDAPFALTFRRQFYLRRGLIDRFLAAARQMNERGWIMKVEDAYRTPRMQQALLSTPALFDGLMKTVLWETGGRRPPAELLDRRLLAVIAFCPAVGTHISGSALDISVLDRDSGRELNRGESYTAFNAKTPMDSPYVSDGAHQHRQAITALMNRHGFVEYPWEFWHYSQNDVYDAVLNGDPGRARYGPVEWDATARTVEPVADPTGRLCSVEQIDQCIQESLRRLGVTESVDAVSPVLKND